MQEFIEQIVKEIVSGVVELDPAQRHMFLVWLAGHASQVCCTAEEEVEACLNQKLATWLGTLSVAGVLWEYRLVLGEIEWRCNLEPVVRTQA